MIDFQTLIFSLFVNKDCLYTQFSSESSIDAVFLTTVITESYRVKIVLSPMEKVRKVAMLSFVHTPEIEIFQSAKIAILPRNYGS